MLDMKKERNREEIDKHSAARDQRETADAHSSFRGTTLSEQLKKIDLSKQGGTLKICDRSICDSGKTNSAMQSEVPLSTQKFRLH
jgi:hypothetical protein